MRILPVLALLLCASCDSIPRDPEGTLDRIRGERVFRVGVIASADAHGRALGADQGRDFLARVAASVQAQPRIEAGASEPLLSKLEEGELDLVIGAMTAKSPWAKAVAFLPPLDEDLTGDGHHQLVAMARNGENGWISLLHRHAKAVAVK